MIIAMTVEQLKQKVDALDMPTTEADLLAIAPPRTTQREFFKALHQGYTYLAIDGQYWLTAI
jgi:hypothetical protein